VNTDEAEHATRLITAVLAWLSERTGLDPSFATIEADLHAIIQANNSLKSADEDPFVPIRPEPP